MASVTAPPLALNPDLDHETLATKFSARGRLQITDFLTSGSARALRDELLCSNGWRRVINGGDKVFEIARHDWESLPDAERHRIDAAVVAAATDGFQFRYELVRVPDEETKRAALSTRLAASARLIAAEETLGLIRRITGFADLRFADAQATLYRPGDFLTRHDDGVAGKNRRLAYVLGLAEEWRPEWGGLLLFNDGEGGIADTVVPRFNALSLFTVPQPHSVSVVAPYAPSPRLSVTGWFRDVVPA